jgi:hypothetical protein
VLPIRKEVNRNLNTYRWIERPDKREGTSAAGLNLSEDTLEGARVAATESEGRRSTNHCLQSLIAPRRQLTDTRLSTVAFRRRTSRSQAQGLAAGLHRQLVFLDCSFVAVGFL